MWLGIKGPYLRDKDGGRRETTNTIHIMKKTYQRTTYTSPEVELLVVRSGEAILTGSPEYGDTGSAGGDTGDTNYGDF